MTICRSPVVGLGLKSGGRALGVMKARKWNMRTSNSNSSADIKRKPFSGVECSSAKEMLASSDVVPEMVPRYLMIDSVETGVFDNYPKHSMIVVLKKFLDIAETESEKVPEVYMWSRLVSSIVDGVTTTTKVTSVNVKTRSDAQSLKLLRTTEIFECKVKVTPHAYRNSSKAKVWDESGLFAPYNDEELAEALISHGVKEIKRGSYVNRQKEKVPGKVYYITFRNRSPPTALYFKKLNIKMDVEEFVDRPTRCFGCQKFGHNKTSCRDKGKVDTCVKCGKRHVTSEENPCTAEAACINCRGAHPASFTRCPAYKQEEVVRKLAKEKEVSPRDIIKMMRNKGEYINYAAPSIAEVVRAQPKLSDNSHTRLDIIEKTMEGLQTAVLSLTSSIQQVIQPKGEESMLSEFEERLKRLEVDNEDKTAKLESALNRVNELQLENAELRKQCNNTEVVNMELEDTGQQISASSQQYKDMEKRLQEREEELEKLKAQTQTKDESIHREYNSLKEKYSTLMEKVKKNASDMDLLRATTKTSQREQDLATELEFSRTEIQMHTSSIAVLEGEQKTQKELLEKARDEICRLKQAQTSSERGRPNRDRSSQAKNVNSATSAHKSGDKR